MMRAARWILWLVFHNFGWKIASLAIAVMIWALVASEPELATFATVRLEYKNLPPHLEISGGPAESVILELRGPAGELGSLSDGRRPSVVVDMSGVQPGERTFMIGESSVKLARSIHLVRAIPSEVHFHFDRLAVRNVPVRVRFAGNSGGVARYAAFPAKLEIAGPASRVERVEAAETDPVDVSTAVGTAQFQVNAFVQDSYVRFQVSPKVTVAVTMKKK